MIFLLIIIIISSNQYVVSEPPILDVQTNLTNTIFVQNSYDKEVSPCPLIFPSKNNRSIFNATEIWKYQLFLSDIKLLEVDEPKEQMTVIMEVVQVWRDARLTWKWEDWENIIMIYTRLDKIWSPPFIVFGASEVMEHRDQANRMVQIVHNGMIDSHIPLKLTTNCKLDMTDFPFDIQTCSIQIGLPSFNSKLFEISVDVPRDIAQSTNLGNSVWRVVKLTWESQEIKPEDNKTDVIKMAVIKLHLKRNPIYYMYMIVLPTFVINSISMAGVFMKNGEKIQIGLTHIMTLTFILGILADKLPKTEVIPFLGKYIIFGLCTMIFAIILSSQIDKLLHVVKNGKNVRRTPYRCIFIIWFQFINLLGGVYVLLRLVDFEQRSGYD
ncbi:unnamed protein product [Caenorhabditis angaria]|uniref:Neurotransmitter-gated ion-channel ligand-binding domain-containing protein n=1 Tax=Caenorhabditis angaria TaxID=860376 RepID=A0A9P1I6S5_9PELO|nr:unnamed protein product [Caenorhabditis angaria]